MTHPSPLLVLKIFKAWKFRTNFDPSVQNNDLFDQLALRLLKGGRHPFLNRQIFI
jgi:hypothetical protein